MLTQPGPLPLLVAPALGLNTPASFSLAEGTVVGGNAVGATEGPRLGRSN